MNIAVTMFKAFEGCIEMISLTLVHGQGKDEIEAKGDLPQKCEFYDVRNLVHSVTSEPFVVQRKFSSQSTKKKKFLLVFLRKEETKSPRHPWSYSTADEKG